MNRDVVSIAKDMIEPYGELLYLTKFGSKLYGTDSPESDEDYKGIYLPSKESLLLNSMKEQMTFNTSNSKHKNSSDDVDIEIKSIHTFLKMLGKGDTGAYDMAFSYTSNDAVVYCDCRMDAFFANINKFHNPANIKSFLGFAISQSRKYSVKGEKVVVLDTIIDYLTKHKNELADKYIKDFYQDLIRICNNSTYCHFCTDNFSQYLNVLSSLYMLTNSYAYFYNCMIIKRDTYGTRAEKVSQAVREGKPSADWKAISHALRCVYEANELLTTGIIKFPLEYRDIIKDIKFGKYSAETALSYIDDGIKTVDSLLNADTINMYDENYVNNYLLSLYM